MLKCTVVYTYELDEPDIALDDIEKQLEEKITILEHTVGIIMCNPEFISAGIVKHIGENLPFDLVGATTASQAVNGRADELILTIFVMTSDDVQFRTGITECMDGGVEGPIKNCAESAGISEIPRLALIFPPSNFAVSGDLYVEAFEKSFPNVPIFGAIATDDTLTFKLSETIYNGENFKNSMPFVLCCGNINPRFIIGMFPEESALPYKGEATKASGHLIYEINNMNAYKYYESIGIGKGIGLSDMLLFNPIMIDQKTRGDYDGISVIRGHAGFTEDGTAVYRGNVGEGSIFKILSVNEKDVLSTTRQKVEEASALGDINGALLFSCIIRRIVVMRPNPLAELEIARDAMRPDIPFMMGYAGGEICPTSVRNETPTNRFHQFSLIILLI